MEPIRELENRVLIHTLLPGDAAHTVTLLARADIQALVCNDIDALCTALSAGAGALLLTEEVLTTEFAACLAQALDSQPAWSDLPIVVVTALQGTQYGPTRVRALGVAINATLVERPVRVHVLVSTVKTALRARARQYEARALLDQRTELLQQAEQARIRAEEANRSKDEFLATVSHELRTPLNAMLGWARLLKSGLPQARHAYALEAIERNALAQAQLVEDLLDVSRITQGKLRLELEPLNLERVAMSAAESLRPAIEAKQLTFSAAIEPHLPNYVGDPVRLQQVVWNLLSNAIKFTPARGQIELRLERAAGVLELAVSDTGEGIEPQFLPHVFERFRQADGSSTRVHGGLGLGLSIVRQIVDLHGGTVHAESAGRGLGSTFVVRLPAARLVAAAKTPAPRARGPEVGAPPELFGLKVLVVDDEADARELFMALLADAGALPMTASSAKEALSSLQEHTPDVVLSDLSMPEQDGYAFIGQVRKLDGALSSIPAAAVTAYARAEDRARTLDSGFNMHLAKPCEPSELLRTVAELARLGKGQR